MREAWSVPIGAPPLVRVGRRLAAWLGRTPLAFIGIVVAVAVLFRVALDLVRPAPAPREEIAPAARGPGEGDRPAH